MNGVSLTTACAEIILEANLVFSPIMTTLNFLPGICCEINISIELVDGMSKIRSNIFKYYLILLRSNLELF